MHIQKVYSAQYIQWPVFKRWQTRTEPRNITFSDYLASQYPIIVDNTWVPGQYESYRTLKFKSIDDWNRFLKEMNNEQEI